MSKQIQNNEGLFVNIDGTASKYTNFNAGEPNDDGAGEDCVLMNNDGKWNDGSCTQLHASVCKCKTNKLKMVKAFYK